MSAAITVPVNYTPEATERVAGLACQAQVQQMLAKMCDLIPEVRRIEVSLMPDYECGGDPTLILDAATARRPADEMEYLHEYYQWARATLPPELRDYCSVTISDEAAYAG